MAAYPDGPLDARLELLLGGTWTDVTADALPDSAQLQATLTSGRPKAAQSASPATLPVTLDNPSGAYTPRLWSSPYYGEIR